MASVKVDCVVKAGALIGEGPLWEEPEQSLLFVDICGQTIHRWHPNTNETQSMETGRCLPRTADGMYGWQRVDAWHPLSQATRWGLRSLAGQVVMLQV